jgi:outer membrane protein assembly factor BamB
MRKTLTVAALALSVLGIAPAVRSESLPYLVRWVRELGFDPIMLPMHPVQRSRPAFSNSDVVVGTRGGEVRAYERGRGNLRWATPVSGPVEADVVRIGTSLYAGTVTGALVALEPEQGAIRWRYQTAHEILGAPVGIGANLIAFTAANNQLFAVHAADGAWVWQYNGGEDPDLSIRGVAGIAVQGTDVFTGFSTGEVARIDGLTGKQIWVDRLRDDTKFEDIDSTPVLAGNLVCVVRFGTKLACLKADDGSIVWTARVSAHMAPALYHGTLVLAGLDGNVSTYRAEDGKAGFSVKLADMPLNEPVVAGRMVFVAGLEGSLWGLDADTGEVRFTYRGGVSGTHAAVLADEREVYLTTNLGHLIKLSPLFK